MISYVIKHKFWALSFIFFAFLSFSLNVSAQEAPKATNAGASTEERVAQRKAERNITLDQQKTKRIESTCNDAQTKIRQARNSYVTVFDKRSEVYRKVDAKLWVAIGNLKLINKDTFKLEEKRSEYTRQVNEYEATAKEFQLVIDDIANVNCKADPPGFMALIETARLYNSEIKLRVDGIKDHVVNQIKPELSSHANEIRPKASQQ